MNGVDLSRMTLAQAQEALSAAGYEKNAEGVSATVVFPNDSEMVISGEEAGFALDASQAAGLAFAYGKDGSLFGNGITYIKSLLNRTELSIENTAEVDEEYVRGVVNDFTSKFNSTLLDDSFTIESDRIVIVKGAGGALADADAVYELTVSALHNALKKRGQETVNYTLEKGDGKEVDLLALFNAVNVEPVPAVYEPETKTVSRSVTGVSFNMDFASAALESARSGEEVVIPLIFDEPEITTEQLEAILFRDVLSERTTYIDGTSNRLNNVKVSAESINGLVLNPGDEFSFNDVVGKRTVARGYKEAGAYVGGRTVQEVGGGICQTSSTLYDCVLYADLEVVYRANHMFTIPYLPLGNDATVNWGTIDFKFKNNTPYPIRIDTKVDGRNLTIEIHGTKLDENYIKVEYTVISTTPYSTVQEESESVAPGTTKVDVSGHTGHVVETYKYLYDKDGNLISKTFIARSSYRSQNRIVLVPVGTLSGEDPTESPTDSPTESPADSPTDSPSGSPTGSPSGSPTDSPSESPSEPPPQQESPAEAPPQIPIETESGAEATE